MKFILKTIINIAINKTILWPFYYPITYLMKEVKTSNISASNGITILALNQSRFRGDLEVLVESGFKVYKMPYRWQTRVFYAYKDIELRDDFLNPTIGSSIGIDRTRLRKYLSHLLRKVFRKKKIDCVISAGLFYNQDFDWGAATINTGCPYVVFHRENLVASKQRIELYKKAATKLKHIGFKGSAVIFQNSIMKNIFDKYSGIDPRNIYSFGSLRMDRYLSRIDDLNHKFRHNRITLFSFTRFNGLPSSGINISMLYESVHTKFIELAIEHPDIEFVIKHKDVGNRDLLNLLDKNRAYNVKNLKIYGDDNSAQDLILSSDVVSSFCTTVLLEAAVARKPIIFPLFYEANDLKRNNSLCFDDICKLCTIVNSDIDYKHAIMHEYQNIDTTEIDMPYRVEQFEKYVSSINKDSTRKYTELLKSLTIDRKL